VSNVAEGIRYAADNGAQVINLSLGGNIKSRILEDAVVHAHKKGVTIVAAAGNSGRSVGWPAAYEDVVAVSASDANDRIAWFSSRGPEIAIGAPGVGVTQQTVCNGGRDKCELFGTFNGTSMASPHVAGAAAILVGLGVTDPGAVRSALSSAARAPKEADPKLYGAGILDAGAAASHVFWTHFMMRSLALLAFGLLVARRVKKRGGAFVRSPAMIVSALVAGVGLVPFAPLVKWFGLPHAGPLRLVAELFARPFGEWDLLAGAGFHRALLLASPLPALAIAALFFGVARVRPVLGGFALGSAALMTQIAISGDSAFFLGAFAMRVWMIGGAFVCLWLARVALDARRAS
jgi:serine protease